MALHSVIYVHNCKDVNVSLEHTSFARWLDIKCEDGRAHINLFFDSQEDQDAVLEKLYNELGKLQPKY